MIFLRPARIAAPPTASPPVAVPSSMTMEAVALETLSKPLEESSSGRYMMNAQ